MRSVRAYDQRPILDDVVTAILEAGRWTGSAKNAQPWQLIVVRDTEALHALSLLGAFAGHVARAPLAIIPVMEKGPGAATRALDCGRLCQNLMLAAHALGVGSCIASIWPAENGDVAASLLGIPDGYEVRLVVAFGYPRVTRARRAAAVPRGRKPLTELVHYERFGRRSA